MRAIEQVTDEVRVGVLSIVFARQLEQRALFAASQPSDDEILANPRLKRHRFRPDLRASLRGVWPDGSDLEPSTYYNWLQQPFGQKLLEEYRTRSEMVANKLVFDHIDAIYDYLLDIAEGHATGPGRNPVAAARFLFEQADVNGTKKAATTPQVQILALIQHYGSGEIAVREQSIDGDATEVADLLPDA